MSDKLKPLWSNNRIGKYPYRILYLISAEADYPAIPEDITILLQRVRDEYETERQQLYAQIAELKKELGK